MFFSQKCVEQYSHDRIYILYLNGRTLSSEATTQTNTHTRTLAFACSYAASAPARTTKLYTPIISPSRTDSKVAANGIGIK